jgi:predicted nucleotidyltransferase
MDQPVATKREVLDRLAASRRSIVNLGVRRLGIFGSFASGRPLDDSDVDMLVEFDPDRKTFDAYWGLSQLLEQTLRRPVDLLTRESLSPHFGPRILAEVEYVALGA